MGGEILTKQQAMDIIMSSTNREKLLKNLIETTLILGPIDDQAQFSELIQLWYELSPLSEIDKKNAKLHILGLLSDLVEMKIAAS